MRVIRRLFALLLILSLFWFIYGDSFEESGFRGVYQDIREDLYQISEYPFVRNTIEWIDEEIHLLSSKLPQNLENENFPSSTPDKPNLDTPTEQSFSINNIELGDHRSEVETELGEPKRASRNEYGVNWLAYHENYYHFVMISYDEHDQVAAMYTNHDLLSSTNGITFASTREDVLATLPEPLKAIRKGFINYEVQNNGEFSIFDIDHSYVTIFYDKHQGAQISAILIIDKDLEKQRKTYFAEPSEALRDGFEQQLFDLTNAARVKHGLPILSWEQSAQKTVRDHSQDMAEQNYFSHTNLEGQSPFDRLTEDAISYRMAGENLAAGQQSSIFAHEGLMNSLGHRENKLKLEYQSLIVGVAFNPDGQPFYTENYLAN